MATPPGKKRNFTLMLGSLTGGREYWGGRTYPGSWYTDREAERGFYFARPRRTFPHITDFELAKTRMLDAERAFEKYLNGILLDIEQHKRLADALRMAIDDLIDTSVALAG